MLDILDRLKLMSQFINNFEIDYKNSENCKKNENEKNHDYFVGFYLFYQLFQSVANIL